MKDVLSILFCYRNMSYRTVCVGCGIPHPLPCDLTLLAVEKVASVREFVVAAAVGRFDYVLKKFSCSDISSSDRNFLILLKISV